MAVPGLTPRSPVMTLGPVLVTVEPPRTAKLWAVPSVDWAQTTATPQRPAANARPASRRTNLRNIGDSSLMNRNPNGRRIVQYMVVTWVNGFRPVTR